MFRSEPVFAQLDDRPMAHCATLTALADGTLLCAWFGGSYETAPDVAILAARRAPGAPGWSSPQVIAAVPGRSLGQPVFLPRPDGTLWLFFDVIMGVDWTSAIPHWQHSRDGGITWDPPAPLMETLGLMFRSKPLVLPGRIILPVYDERTWQSLMLISDDDGRSWRRTAPLVSPAGNIHPCVVPLSDGRLLAYLRTGGAGGVIWRAESADGGESWTEPEPTALPNPNSGIDLIRLASGRLALAFNDSDRLRTPLCVALAGEDECWRWKRTIEDGHAEYSYPTLLQTGATIHLVYTARREHIHAAHFDEAWLLEGEVSRELAYQGRHRPAADAV